MWQDHGDDNIYEGEVSYSNNQVRIPDSSCKPPLPGRSCGPMSPRKTVVNDTTSGRNFEKPAENKTTKWIFFVASSLVLIGILVIGSLVMTGIVLSQMSRTVEPTRPLNGSIVKPQVGQSATAAKTCWDLKKTGTSESGLHKVDTGGHDHKIEVFCDMETDGGGWTLVASIHENDINEKCDMKDRWATHLSPGYIGTIVKTNWENKITFGDPRKCMTDDYKNSIYYSAEAQDVMLWHVPSGTSLLSMRKQSTLRYRTTNQFFRNEGGNLYSLFNDRYPLTLIKRRDRVIPARRTRKVLEALYANHNAMKSKVSNWHQYSYTGADGEYKIVGDQVYTTSNGGNRITFRSAREVQGYYLNYEKEYEYTRPDFLLSMKRTQPFMMVAVISNEYGRSTYFRTEVLSYPVNSAYTDELIENNITFHNFELQYRAAQSINPSGPTVCEFHFIVFNKKEWGSTPPSFFNRTYNYRPSSYRNYYFEAKGTPTNFIMGYLLLTRTTGNKITIAQADAVSNVIMDSVSSFIGLFNENFPLDGLAVPVTFDKGDASAVLSMIPPLYRPFVEPGYLQFRAYNITGYPNAICPGIKMKSFHPEHICVGGISEDIQEIYGTCGDFAGWAGRKGDIIQFSSANGHAHSRADIASTILIFYR